MTEQQTIITYATSQVGYKETGNNITKYAAEIDKNWPNFYNGKKQGAAWCDIFVDYCFLHNFDYEKALNMLCQPPKSCGAGCKFSAQYYKSAGRWHTTPVPGDQIFFYVGGEINHTGIVIKVDGSKVYTVEGNSNDEVKKHSYSLSSKKIAGYGRPRYSEEASPVNNKPSGTVTPALIDSIARDVIRGKYGNGNARRNAINSLGYGDIYIAVQKRVNQILLGR